MSGTVRAGLLAGEAERTARGGAPVAAEVMSRPVVTVRPEDSLAMAWDAMRQRRVRHLVVVDDGSVVAVLDAWTVAARWPGWGPGAARRTSVNKIIRRGVHCVGPDTPVRVVAQVMRRTGSDAVPVVTETGQLLGLITSTDLVAGITDGTVQAGQDGRRAGPTAGPR